MKASGMRWYGVGLTASDTVKIQLLDPKPMGPVNPMGMGPGAAPAPAVGIVKGIVREGDRPQANLPVALTDQMGMVKATSTTDAAGRFLIKDVPAGVYQVTSTKSASRTRGSAPVTVIPGLPEKEVKDVEVKLFRP